MTLDPAPYFDLGTFSRPVSTASTEAQTWFDRGLIWSYGFNHEEAVRCFEQAVAADPGLALAHWGIAYAAGPNYNKDWDAFEPTELAAALRLAHESVERARQLAASGGAAPVEVALIEALAARFPQPEPPADGDFSGWKEAYAEATGEAYGAHPHDLDVAAIHADALMNLSAWQLWDVATGAVAEGARTREIQRILTSALAQPGGMAHPGLLHLQIHLLEMSAHPERALPAADALRDLVPDAGHLVHMPTHIDVLTGDYGRVIEGNARAARADARYAATEAAPGFYTLYRAHDLHFLIYGAMFAGQQAVALQAAADLEALMPEELLRMEVPPMADWLESFAGMRVHVLVRFGLWDVLAELPLPSDPELYCVTTALTHYGRGVAFAAAERTAEARAEQEAFRAAVGRVPDSRYLFNNTAIDILGVADAMLDGEILYREGHVDDAYAQLREAIRREDTLPYDEPWGWMQPVRHAYGALLLEQGHVEEAAAAYAADLGYDHTLGRACQHPGNVWALHGYLECLNRLGRDAEATIVARQFELASARADVPIMASCACRLSAMR